MRARVRHHSIHFRIDFILDSNHFLNPRFHVRGQSLANPNCQIYGNVADMSGGGIYSLSQLTITDGSKVPYMIYDLNT